MNKPNSIHKFDVFNKVEYITTESKCKPLQTISLKLIKGRVWLNTSTNKEITLRTTNIKHHYLAIGNDNKEYILLIHY